MNSKACVVSLVAIAGLIGLAPSAAAAVDEEPVHVRGMEGSFTVYALEGAWQQWMPLIDNATDAPARCKIAFHTVDPNRGEIQYFRIVEVPAKTIRRTFLFSRPGQLPLDRNRASATAMPTSELTFVLSNPDTGAQLKVMSRPVVRVESDVTRLAIVSNVEIDDEDQSYLNALPEQELGNVRLIRSALASHPNRWQGYSIASVILLGGVEMGKLQASQLEAILDWVRRGGVLVLTGSPTTPDMLNGPLADAAGVTAAGVHYIDSLAVKGPAPGALVGASVRWNLPQLDTEKNPVKLSWPLPMVELNPNGATVFYEANGLPLLTHRSLGHGQVFTLAVPPGGLIDPSLHALWRVVNQARNVLPPVNDNDFLTPSCTTLMNLAGRRGPPRETPVLILGALAGLALVLGLVLRRRRRGELAWMVLVPVALIVAVAMYCQGLRQAAPERLTYVGLLSGLGDGRARVQESFAYYSGPENRRNLTFSSGSPTAIIQNVGETVAAAVGVEYTQCADIMTLPDQSVNLNSSRAFYVDSVLQSPGVEGTLTFGLKGLEGVLNNSLGADIEDAVLYVNRRTYRLGTLRAGPTPVSIAPGDLLGNVQFLQEDSQLITKGQFSSQAVTYVHRSKLITDILARPGVVRRVDAKAVLIGYMNQSPVDPLSGRELSRAGWCLVAWPVTYRPAPPGTPVKIPPGFVSLDYDRIGASVWDVNNERFNPASWGMELLVLARPPRGVSLSDASADLAVSIGAPNYRLTVSGVPAGGGPSDRVALKTFDSPSGKKEVAIRDANRFRRADGAYVFSLKVDRLGEPSQSPTETGAQWSFETINVALEGITR